MSQKVISGLDHLCEDKSLQKKYSGKVGYLCHSASVGKNFRHGLYMMQETFGKRLTKVFAPQHGFVTDVQDNMVESNHYTHPFFQLPIYSLYSETRIPTDEMLEGLDHIFVDLQDIGTRIYTYVYTMTHLMEACRNKDIDVVILDRPNPIGGVDLEGNILEAKFNSFVGRHPCPVRHGLTMAEFALMAKKYWGSECKLDYVKMPGWKREMYFEDTQMPWVMPSPNIPMVDSCFPFVGTVLFEGTNISEGRGTTHSLEIVGHPGIEAFSFYEKHLKKVFEKSGLKGFILRPLVFMPTFQKHAGKQCGGYQIHVTDRKEFKSWRVSQILCREFYHHLGEKFQWKKAPYEYVHDREPIDVINGTDKIRLWVEKNGKNEELDHFENESMQQYKEAIKTIFLY
ncbi:MAG: DUF1343 domain-containing protein [Bacteriovoracaceae bacterium]|nr:DUF1343 domain-containing protein [Bacteriovoracaceae bacterium]